MKIKNSSLYILSVVGLVIGFALGYLAGNVGLFGTSDMSDDSESLIINAMYEEDDTIRVVTTYGSFSYPFAFSDIIKIEAINGDNSARMKFSACFENLSLPVFTLHFNDDMGIPCGIIKLKGKEIPVSVVLEKEPDNLKDDYKITFLAAQEVFNDVLNSMADNETFTVV